MSDPVKQRRLMRETLSAIEPNRDLGFMLVHLVAAFIDGLVRAPKGQTKARYIDYLRAHFPALCKVIRPEDFYEHIRNKAIHEFNVLPPFAFAHQGQLQDPTAYVEAVRIGGQQWTLVNVEKVVEDFRAHLDSLGKP